MQVKSISVIILSLIFIFNGCKEEQTPKVEALVTGYTATIKTPAGTFEGIDSKTVLVPPFNLARLNNVNDKSVIVLSEAMAKGKVLKVLPIGVLKAVADSTFIDYIITVPSEVKYNHLKLKSYADLSVYNTRTKSMIENWCKQYHADLNNVKLTWYSEQTAIELIDLSMQIKS